MTFKSKLEQKFAKDFKLPYETDRFKYVKEHTYTPDFKVSKTAFIETKGRFTSADRSKMKAVLQQHPELKIALVFQKPHQLLTKNSTTSYAVWAHKNGFTWFDVNDKAGIQRFIEENK